MTNIQSRENKMLFFQYSTLSCSFSNKYIPYNPTIKNVSIITPATILEYLDSNKKQNGSALKCIIL